MPTSTHQQPPVVVGTDGSSAALQGVRWAAREASRLGTGLIVAHVLPENPVFGPALPIPEATLRQHGTRVLESAAALAREEVPDLTVEVVLVEGTRVMGLVETARSAALLVLGTEHRSLSDRVWTGATVAGVAARSTAPVVVLGDAVSSSVADGVEHGRIVVGAKTSTPSHELLAAAFALARSRSAEMVVLRAWKLAPYFDEVVANRGARTEWRDRETARIEEALVDFRERHPDVRVRVDVVHEQPAAALVAASATADRLMLERPVRGGVLHHLGSVARAVLRESRCPVEVLAPTAPVGSSATTSDLAPESGETRQP